MHWPSQLKHSLPAWMLISSLLALVAAVLLVLAGSLPWKVLVLAPFAGAALPLFLLNTQRALCFCAFALMPLGGLHQEILGVTFYLPEVLLIALILKEALVSLAARERLVAYLPALPLALYLAAASLALGTGLFYGHGLVAVFQDCRQWVEFIILFWLVLQRVQTREQLIQLLWCFLAGAIFGALHAVYQYQLNREVLQTEFEGLAASADLRSGSFFHPNTFAGLMSLSVGVAAALLWTTPRRAVKAMMLLCIILFLIAQVYTASRGAWLGALFMFAFMALYIRPTKRVVLLAAVGAIVLAIAAGPLAAKRLATLSRPQSDQSLMDRAQHYTAARHIIRDYPVFGLGWGAYFDITDVVNEGHYTKSAAPPGELPGTVHSLYLQLFAKMGIFGLIAFIALLAAWLERVWRVLRTRHWDSPEYRLFAMISAGVAGVLVQNGIENYFHHQVMGQSFWLMLGASFLTAHWMAPQRAPMKVPLLALAAAATAFLIFLYGSLALAKLDMRNEYFARSVRIAMAEGKTERAMALATAAAQAEHPSEMAFALRGQLLLEAGETEEGLEELHRALQVVKQSAPPFQDTRKPFYLPLARLLLGRHALAQGQTLEAVEHFELAQAYADLSAPEFAAYHPVLYRAYADQKLWARALRYGTPAAADLESLPSEELQGLARITVAREAWPLAGLMAEQLLARREALPLAQYALGRVKLAGGSAAEAVEHLRQAASGRHQDAAYFLGKALEAAGQREEAVKAYSAIPVNSLYRAIGLGQACRLTEASAAGNQQQKLLAALDKELEALRSRGRVTTNEATAGAPAAITLSDAHPAMDGIAQVAVLWDLPQASSAALPVAIETSTAGGITLHRGGTQTLLVQAVENLVNWEAVQAVPEGSSNVPGWTDITNDWLKMRAHSAMLAEVGERQRRVLSFLQAGWFYTVPVKVEPHSDYILLARAQGEGSVGWQFLAPNEGMGHEDKLSFTPGQPEMWRLSLARAQPEWEVARVAVELRPRRGSFSLSEVLMFQLALPGPPETSADSK